MWNSIKAETKVIYPASTIKTHTICVLLLSLARLVLQVSTKNFCYFSKASYFWRFLFSYFHGQLANIKLNIMYIVGSTLKSWSVLIVLGMYNFGWDFTFTNTSTHHSCVIFLLLFCRGIVVSNRTAPFVQQYFVRSQKDSTFGTTWEIANTLYRPVIFACKSTKKTYIKIVQLLS